MTTPWLATSAWAYQALGPTRIFPIHECYEIEDEYDDWTINVIESEQKRKNKQTNENPKDDDENLHENNDFFKEDDEFPQEMMKIRMETMKH